MGQESKWLEHHTYGYFGISKFLHTGSLHTKLSIGHFFCFFKNLFVSHPYTKKLGIHIQKHHRKYIFGSAFGFLVIKILITLFISVGGISYAQESFSNPIYDDYLNSGFRNNQPTDESIINKLYGENSLYRSGRNQKICNTAEMQISYIDPGTNTIPEYLSGNTIYALMGGDYTNDYSIKINSDCTALVAISGGILRSTNYLTSAISIDGGKNIILDNLKIAGESDGLGNIHSANDYGIYSNTTNATINNLNFYYLSGYGIYFDNINNNYVFNSKTYTRGQIELQATQDTTLDSDKHLDYQSRNYGQSDFGYISNDGAAYLIKFDFSSLPSGAIVTNGSLVLTKLDLSGKRFYVREIINNDRAEGIGDGIPSLDGEPSYNYLSYPETTWYGGGGGLKEGYDYGYNDLVDYGNFSNKLQSENFQLNDQGKITIQNWINNSDSNQGFALVFANNRIKIGSRENANPGYQPKLILNYEQESTWVSNIDLIVNQIIPESITTMETGSEIISSGEITKQETKDLLKFQGFKENKKGEMVGNKPLNLGELNGEIAVETVIQSTDEIENSPVELKLPEGINIQTINGEDFTGILNVPEIVDNDTTGISWQENIILAVKIGEDDQTLLLKDGSGNDLFASIQIPTPDLNIGDNIVVNYSNDGNTWNYLTSTIITGIAGQTYAIFDTNHFTTFGLSFTGTTPADNAVITGRNYFSGTIDIIETGGNGMRQFIWSWNGTDYNIYDSGLVYFANFNNVSNLGEDASTIKDLSQYNRTGTLAGVTSKVVRTGNGKYGGSYIFNASSLNNLNTGGYITVNNFPYLTSYTILVRVNTMYNATKAGGDGYSSLVNRGTLADANTNFDLVLRTHYTAGIRPGLYYRSGSTTFGLEIASGPTVLKTGGWTHVAATINTSPTGFVNLAIYLSGNLIGSKTGVMPPGNGGQALNIGGITSLNKMFSGQIDDVMIYNRALSSGEINRLYYSSLSKYDSGNWLFTTITTGIVTGKYLYGGTMIDSGGINYSISRYVNFGGLPTVSIGYISSGATGMNGSTLYFDGGGNFDIRADVSDGIGGLSGTTCQYTTGGDIWTGAVYQTTYCEVTGLTYPGDINIRFRILDNASNLATGATGTYLYDGVGPSTTTLLSPTSGQIFNNGDSVSFLRSGSVDTGIGISGYVYQLSTGSTFTNILSSGSILTTGIDIGGLSIGTYYWRVYSFDKFGNTGTWQSTSGIFIISSTSPYVVIPNSLTESDYINAFTGKGYYTGTGGVTGYRVGITGLDFSTSSTGLVMPAIAMQSTAFNSGVVTVKFSSGVYFKKSNGDPFTGIFLGPTQEDNAVAGNIQDQFIKTVIKLGSGGESINLKTINGSDMNVEVRIPLTGVSIGDIVSVHYSSDTSTWTYLTSSTVTGISGVPYVIFDTNHFTWYAIGKSGWDNDNFLNSGFWNLSPSSGNIVWALYGGGSGSSDTTAYTRNRNQVTCITGNMIVVYTDGSHLPTTLATNTIYVVSSGNYSNIAQTTFSDCSALISSGSVILNKSSTANAAFFRAINKSNIIIDNIAFNAASQSQFLMNFTGTSNSTFNNISGYNATGNGLRFYNGANYNSIYNSDIYNNSGYGISFDSSSSGNVNNSDVKSNTSGGIMFDNSPNARVDSCPVIDGNGEYGIYSTGSNFIIITGSKILNSTDNGIYFYNSSNGIINNVESAGNDGDGIFLIHGSNYNVITSSSFHDNTNHGIDLHESYFNTITNSKSYLNDNGIQIGFSTGNKFNYCQSYNNTENGIYTEHGSFNVFNNVNIFNNGLDNVGQGIFFRADSQYNALNNSLVYNNEGDGIRLHNTATVNVFNNSMIYNNAGNGISLSGGGSATIGNIFNDLYIYNNELNGIDGRGSISNKYYGTLRLFANLGSDLIGTDGYDAALSPGSSADDLRMIVLRTGGSLDTGSASMSCMFTDNIRNYNLERFFNDPCDIRGTIPWNADQPVSYLYGGYVLKQIQPVLVDPNSISPLVLFTSSLPYNSVDFDTEDTGLTLDGNPDQFTFVDVTGAKTGQTYISNTITLTGMAISLSVPVEIDIGLLKKNGVSVIGGKYTTGQNGDEFYIELISSSQESTTVSSTMTVGKISDTYSVTTEEFAPPSIPELISPISGETLTVSDVSLVRSAAVDTGIGMSGYVVQRSNSSTFLPTNSATIFTTGKFLGGLSNNTYYRRVYAFDLFGNTGGRSEIWNFVINVTPTDTTAPTLIFVPPTPINGSIITGNNFSGTMHITETGAGLDEFIRTRSGTQYPIYDSGLVLMMNFDNVANLGETNGAISDMSQYGNGGSGYGGISQTSNGKRNGTYDFDGTDDYIDINTGVGNFGTEDFTISFYAKYPSQVGGTNNYAMLLGKNDTNPPYPGIRIFASNIGQTSSTDLKFMVSDNDYIMSNATNLDDDTRRHYTFIRKDSELRIYINGVLDNHGSINLIDVTNSDIMRLGAKGNSTTNENFQGQIDELRIRDRALSTGEVQQFYYTNLAKYDIGEREFDVNYQCLRSDTQSFTYSGYASDLSTNSVMTGRSVTVNLPSYTWPGPLGIDIGSTGASTSIRTLSGQFTGYFKFIDRIGTTGWTTTIQLPLAMSGVNNSNNAINWSNIYFKGSGIDTINGISTTGVYINSGLSGYISFSGAQTYIQRDYNSYMCPGGEYGNKPYIKVEVPAFQSPDTYSGSITYDKAT